jgi:hypothetical protein
VFNLIVYNLRKKHAGVLKFGLERGRCVCFAAEAGSWQGMLQCREVLSLCDKLLQQLNKVAEGG